MSRRFVLASASAIALTAASIAAGGQTLTCAQVHGGVGCCAQNAVHYCRSGVMKTAPCTDGRVCGWNAAGGNYGCMHPPAAADPSRANPRSCP